MSSSPWEWDYAPRRASVELNPWTEVPVEEVIRLIDMEQHDSDNYQELLSSGLGSPCSVHSTPPPGAMNVEVSGAPERPDRTRTARAVVSQYQPSVEPRAWRHRCNRKVTVPDDAVTRLSLGLPSRKAEIVAAIPETPMNRSVDLARKFMSRVRRELNTPRPTTPASTSNLSAYIQSVMTSVPAPIVARSRPVVLPLGVQPSSGAIRLRLQQLLPFSLSTDSAKEDCSICLDALGSHGYRLRCTHLFHKECISRWVTEHPLCPLCKTSIF